MQLGAPADGTVGLLQPHQVLQLCFWGISPKRRCCRSDLPAVARCCDDGRGGDHDEDVADDGC